MTTDRWRPAAALLAYAPWAAVLALLVVETWFLCDDAFICFRYARNLIEGEGLCFNAGERVEGYTQLLWVLQLAAAWAWLGMRPELAAPVMSVGCTLLTLVLVWRVARAGGRVAPWIATGVLCVSASFAAWSTGGLETRQFSLLVFAALWLLSDASGWRARLAVGGLLGAATLTRPEAALIGGVALGVRWALGPRTVSMRGWLVVMGPWLALAGAQLAFRWLYYGEWLPNTYYAKHVRPWPEAGGPFLLAAICETALYLQLPLALVGAVARRGERRGVLHRMGLASVAAHAAYVVWIGGDYFEYRFFDFYWPLLAVAAADGVIAISRGRPLPAIGLGVVLVGYVAVLQDTAVWRVRDLQSRAETSYLFVEHDPERSPWLRWLPGVSRAASISNRARRANLPHLVGQTVREHAVFGRARVRDWSPYERMPRGSLPSDAVAAAYAVGVMPFYLPDLTVVDRLGLCDAVIAHTPVSTPNAGRKIAHDRRPPPGYLAERGVNFEPRPAASTQAQALERAEYAVRVGDGLWMPFESPDAEWVQRAFGHLQLERRPPLNLVARSEGVEIDGVRVRLSWNAPQWTGRSYRLLLSNGSGPTTWRGVQLPLDADALLQATATDALPACVTGARGVVDASGVITAEIIVPTGTAWRGHTVHAAFVILGPSGIDAVSPPRRFGV